MSWREHLISGIIHGFDCDNKILGFEYEMSVEYAIDE